MGKPNKKNKPGLPPGMIPIVVSFLYFRRYKGINLVRYRILDYLSDKPVVKDYCYKTPYNRNEELFFEEFLSKVITSFGEYICFMDHRRNFFIEYRHVLIFTSVRSKRTNLSIEKLLRTFLKYTKYGKNKNTYKLNENNTHITVSNDRTLVLSGLAIPTKVMKLDERLSAFF